LHDAGNPVLVLRGDLSLPPRVIFCVDLSSPDAASMVERGLTVVSSLCRDQPAETRILLVVKLEMDLPFPSLHEDLSTAATVRLREFVEALPPGAPIEQKVRIGPPGKEISDEAAEWQADLIVVGTHARIGIARAILGSVAESVVRDAHCSVLVVPPTRLH
jgi:nucleotide-binding universal stress UspA family protein